MCVADVYRRVRMMVAIPDQVSQLTCAPIASDGPGVVPQLASTVSQAVPGSRLADLVAELSAERYGLLTQVDSPLDIAHLEGVPAEHVQSSPLSAPRRRGPSMRSSSASPRSWAVMARQQCRPRALGCHHGGRPALPGLGKSPRSLARACT